MRSPLGLIFGVALAWLSYILFNEAHGASNLDDHTRVAMLFVGVVLTAVAAAVTLVVTFLPAIGDFFGNLFFNPNEKFDKAPHADALSAIARGDYEAAAEEYLKIVNEHPEDTMALSELARIYCEKLENPQAAEQVIEDALAHEGAAMDDAGFLTIRLAEVYWKYQHDIRKARELLLGVIEDFPNTQHSNNATHRLQEIERQLATEE